MASRLERAGSAQTCGVEDLGDFFAAQKAAHRIARLGAASEPMLDALRVQLNFGRLFERIVGAHIFHHAPITWLAALNDHYTVVRPLFLTNSGQSNR